MSQLVVALLGCRADSDVSQPPPIASEPDPSPTSPTTSSEDPDPTVPNTAAANAARDVLYARCSTCHQPEQMVARWVVPGPPIDSPLYRTVVEATMPTDWGGGPLSEAEAELVRLWLDEGAPRWVDGPSRGFVSPWVEVAAARHDVLRLDVDSDFGADQGNARYLSLLPLYNAGVPAADIQAYAAGLTKLVWSLTTERGISPLVPVALDGVVLQDGSVVHVADDLGSSLLFRVDQQDVGWDDPLVDVWEEMVARYPYAVSFADEFDEAGDLIALTGSRSPIVRGDWFAARASLAPLYAEILDLPDDRDAFLGRFGRIDPAQLFEPWGEVECSGIDAVASLVSAANRVMCRYDEGEYCWETFDFSGNVGPQDIFANPTGFPTASEGSEVLCELETGMHVWAIFDGDGQRLDEAPTTLVTDYAGNPIRGALDCIACHDAGVHPTIDQVLGVVLGAPQNYTDEVVDQVTEWYPDAVGLADTFADDEANYVRALDAAGVVLGVEPISALAADHEADLGVERMAADLGVPEGSLADRLANDAEIEGVLGPVLAGGVVTRAVVEAMARDAVCSLELGDACDEGAFCGASATLCPSGTSCDAGGRCANGGP